MEAEAREILTDAVRTEEPRNFAEALMETFGRLGGVELDLPPRSGKVREPPDFSGPEYDRVNQSA
jgi:plasmid stability protein